MAPATSSKSGSSSNDPYNGDPLMLTGGDLPHVKIVTVPFDGSNFHRWNKVVKISLTTKVKIGFITGSCKEPAKGDPNLDQWRRCDSMVISWLLNSMTTELSNVFLYASSAKELWDELCERFGQSNGPLLFQVQKEIADLVQGNDNLTVYYTKLKKYWDELNALCELPMCTCGAMKKLVDFDQQQKLMKLLMNLTDSYDSASGQLLMMDPLSTVNKA